MTTRPQRAPRRTKPARAAPGTPDAVLAEPDPPAPDVVTPDGPTPDLPHPDGADAGGPAPVAAEVVPGAILVEFADQIGAWQAGSRTDVLLRGQIISTAPAESFAIADPSGRDLIAIAWGRDDLMAPIPLDDGTSGYRATFQVHLPMAGGDEVRISDLWVRAEARDGARFLASMRLGCMGDRAAVLAGPRHDLPVATLSPPSGIVYLEAAELSAAGRLRVSGWAVCDARIVVVQIVGEHGRIGTATHGLERGDVGQAFPDMPNAARAGFALEMALPAEHADATHVTVNVLCLTGACHSVTVPLTRTAGPVEPSWDIGRAILMACDQAVFTAPEVVRVSGWAYCPSGLERIAIEIDGRTAGDAEHGLDRPDVANEYPGIPAAIGFAFEQRVADLADTDHQVRVIVRNTQGDEKDVIVPLANPERPAFRFELDKPLTRDGLAADPVTGRLTIEGWALARDGLDSIEVSLNGTVLGRAHHGLARPDVGLAFPDWAGAARAGYSFHCPARVLPDGEQTIELTARSLTGGTHVHAFRVTVRKPDDPEAMVSIRRDVKLVERTMLNAVLADLAWRPAFHLAVIGSAVVPDVDRASRADIRVETAAEAAARAWRLTIRSILEQSWADWRVTLIAHDPAQAAAIAALVAREAHDRADHFQVIEASALSAWSAVTGDAALIGFLAPGDELGRDALGAFALATGLHREADCLYADEFRLPGGGGRPDAFFKPDFSPALLRATNYIGRPLIVRPAVLAASGVTPGDLARDGFHDLALRCTEQAARVHHVSDLLSRTDTGLPPDIADEAAAILQAQARQGEAAEVVPGMAPGTWRARPVVKPDGKVSIIIPTRAAKGYIETCLTTLKAITAYKNFEIVVIDNIPDEETHWKDFVRTHADKIVAMPPPFNWSRFNNAAADASDGDYLLFLNDDIEVEEPGWLDALLEEAARPGVGVAGARLLYPNRTVQHAGMFLGHGMGRHAFRHAGEAEGGYFGLALTRRETIAVTGACLMVRRDTFEALGRFDEAHDVINNDLDFCLRVHRAGLRTIYTPFATLVHHELASRGEMTDDFDTARFDADWRLLFAAGDPYFNPRLSRHSDDYLVDDESLRVLFPGHPLLDPAAVRAILVVKLDHLGDFVTALPAIRALKAEFPNARLTALVAPASAVAARLEPAIDETIPFAFFHARSELGERDLTPADLAALSETLEPYRFDLAVDLRKHLSTRHILRCSGAKVLAGFDSLGAFPWLDIALEWDGDSALRHKRSHITDDLLNLVGAIATACGSDRHLFHGRIPPMSPVEMPMEAQLLFMRPVVAIHPGAGNVMKELRERHIAALIELLVSRDDVSVLLVGGADDAEKAAAQVARAGRPDRVVSVAGKISLADLPRLLAACHLFIGGDSGPKHFAAGVGVPTIGVHSGVVSPGEWGPMGERAVAMYRDMSCAPCFLAKPDDCPRGLACIELIEPALIHRMARVFLARPVAAARRAPMTAPAVAAPAGAAPTGAGSGPPNKPPRATRRSLEPMK